MRNKFDEQLKQLNNEMIEMANMIESAIQNAITAFLKQDVDTAKKIMNSDEIVDQKQKTIESICFQLLIQQQPVARDLRTITAAMKMVTDMERIGDQAADISELTIVMADSPYRFKEDHIKAMASETSLMVIKAIEAYVEKDLGKAYEVIARDDIVDNYFLKVKADLIEVMQKEADYAEHAADLLMVNKYLERIGDHATNIAEWVIFSIDDHSHKE
ncbi:MAG: phosphate signaling complex protein PhoU [Erysipelotrichaceae bacterium]|nr:phosphate signaling complex protein PhoU [Erysipelotrichaceae bacterium]